MSFRNLWLLLPLLALFSEVYWIFLKKVDYVESRIEKADQLLALQSGKAVGQTFLARQNGLSGVRLLVLVPGRGKVAEIEFHLQRVGRKGREYNAQLKEAAEDGWMEFRFAPISRSGGYVHHYYIVTNQESDPPVRIAFAANDEYVEGKAYGQDVPEGADLFFQCVYSRTIHQSLNEILAGKPFLFGNQFFLMTVLIVYNFAIALWFLRLRSSSRQAEF